MRFCLVARQHKQLFQILASLFCCPCWLLNRISPSVQRLNFLACRAFTTRLAPPTLTLSTAG